MPPIAHLRTASLTVVPLSLHAATAPGERTGVRLVLPGGEVEPVELTFRGARAVESVRALHVDVAIVSGCAADPAHGIMSTTLDDADPAALAVYREGGVDVVLV